MTLSISPASRGRIGQSIIRGLVLLIAQIPALHSNPLIARSSHNPQPQDDDVEKNPDSGQFWIYMGTSVVLVLLGGVFAGLTLGLMGQDEIYLQVIEQSGEPQEKKNAKGVLRLLKRGKHWVLVTLLLSNVITNETLPIVLDRGLGGGWPAVVSSTIAIVIFGEIIPQSVCVRYGLSIGAYLSPFVLFLMYLMYPVAYPTALLLDKILGEDHGTTYKKAGLKTLVTLHKTLGPSPADRLNQDEVTIISAVLDLKDKPVGSIMTPMEDVFTMSADTVLDEQTMDNILSAGYSRIPIHAPGEPMNFIGMLLVKMLITYDPEDALKVSHFSLATLPETAPETSCLDIVNFFQEGKSHMVLVSDYPGENYGALGVVTLEDVIEELIGEEIIDESDVYIDVHKAIRRLNPAPIARRTWTAHVVPQDKVSDTAAAAAANQIAGAIAAESHDSAVIKDDESGKDDGPNGKVADYGAIKRIDACMFPPKRKLSGGNLPPALAESLRHLGPSNQATNPKKTTSKTVKIKTGTAPDDPTKLISITSPVKPKRQVSFAEHSTPPSHALNRASEQHEHVFVDDVPDEAAEVTVTPNIPVVEQQQSEPSGSNASSRSGSMRGSGNTSPLSEHSFKKVKSGSLVEINKEIGGIKKVIVEATSSSESEEPPKPSGSGEDLLLSSQQLGSSDGAGGESSASKKKKKKNKKKKKKNGNGGSGKDDSKDEDDEDDAHEGTSLLGKK